MDELPELPFELVLSYLSLEDRLKARAVSRRWYHQINSLKVKTLCYSQRPAGFIEGKSRLVSGAFAQNFISSTRFGCFFTTFRPTILSNLKHLRLCGLRLNNKKTRKSFARALQSFGQLEELDIIRLSYHPNSTTKEVKLTLPMLTSIRLEEVRGFEKLELDAPKLRKISFLNSFSALDLVHAESVEWLHTDSLRVMAPEKMKNLKVLYSTYSPVDPTFLSSLQQLKVIHLGDDDADDLDELFEEKQRLSLTDLKIYLWGLLLDSLDDPAIGSLLNSDEELLRCLAENPSRLADQIPFSKWLDYPEIEPVAAKTEMSLLKRFTNLNRIEIRAPVENAERFLNLLKNLDGIEQLDFECDQPQDLFDRLPEHCDVQNLFIFSASSDIRFLFRLKHLMHLNLDFSIDAGAIRKIIEKNEFLSCFYFNYLNKQVGIEVDHPKRFSVWFDFHWIEVPNLDAAIQLIATGTRPKKRTKMSKNEKRMAEIVQKSINSFISLFQ